MRYQKQKSKLLSRFLFLSFVFGTDEAVGIIASAVRERVSVLRQVEKEESNAMILHAKVKDEKCDTVSKRSDDEARQQRIGRIIDSIELSE